MIYEIFQTELAVHDFLSGTAHTAFDDFVAYQFLFSRIRNNSNQHGLLIEKHIRTDADRPLCRKTLPQRGPVFTEQFSVSSPIPSVFMDQKSISLSTTRYSWPLFTSPLTRRLQIVIFVLKHLYNQIHSS